MSRFSGTLDTGGHTPWFVDDPKTALSHLRTAIICLLAAIWLVAAATLAVANDRARSEALGNQLMFTSVMALNEPDQIGAIVAASQGEAMIVDEGGVRQVLMGPNTRSGLDHDRWRNRVANLALVQDGRLQFSSSDPDGQSWTHTSVVASGDTKLVYSTPEWLSGSFRRTMVLTIATAATVATAAVLLVCLFLFKNLVVPVLVMVEAGDDLVVRGQLRFHTKRELSDLKRRPAEYQRLGEILRRISSESQNSAHRNESLLAAANALGGSLDPTDVLDRSLEHLQRLLHVERSAILRYEPRTRVFQAIAMRGHDISYGRDLSASPYDPTSPSVRATREQIPVQISDTDSEVVSSEITERGRRHGYRSLLAVPISSGLAHPTVLVLHSAVTRNFSFDEVELCRSFASIAGAALRNAELYARIDHRLQQQTSTLSAIVDSVDQGLVVEPADGKIVFTNATMDRLIGPRSGSDLAIEEMVDELLQFSSHAQANKAEIGRLDESEASWADVELIDWRGKTRDFRVRMFTVRDSRGLEVGHGQTWTDVTRDRELDRMKEGLLAAVSHEFRTPLALIKGYATTLLADDVSWTEEDQRQFLSLVSGEADRLAGLVERLLDMRRIDAGIVALQIMPTKLVHIIESACDGVLESNDRIEFDPIPDIAVDCDAARISTALRNLLENACKYSPDDRPVNISVETGHQSVSLLVSDHGPGIDPTVRPRIFDTFVRGEDGLTAGYGGIGLGLAIAKGFVEAHDGQLTLDETVPGSRFRITLPIAPVKGRSIESAGVRA